MGQAHEPASGQINNSNLAVGHVLALVSFAHALGGILAGTAVIAIYQSCDRKWSREVLSATRLRLYLIPLLMAWPSVSLFLSVIFLTASMLHTVLTPSVVWLRAVD